MPRGRPRKNPDRRRRRALDGDRFQLKAPPIPGYETRWIRDTGNRLHNATVDDDWDFVTKQEIPDSERPDQAEVGDPGTTPEQGLGDKVSKIGGYMNGRPYHMYLCKKRKEFYEEDKKAKREDRDDVMRELKKGHAYVENREGGIEVG